MCVDVLVCVGVCACVCVRVSERHCLSEGTNKVRKKKKNVHCIKRGSGSMQLTVEKTSPPSICCNELGAYRLLIISAIIIFNETQEIPSWYTQT